MKRLIPLLLCSAMLTSSIPTQPRMAAAEPAVSSSFKMEVAEASVSNSKDTSDKALEKAILAVKSKITIPAEYSEFDYYYSTAYSGAASYWSLTWRKPGDYSYITIHCDTANRITYYTKYDSANKNRDNLPVFLKKELKSNADEFIKKIAPEIAGKLEYVGSEYESFYSGRYAYTYQRIENGIILPENNVVIRIDSVSGEVQEASISWLYDVKVPAKDIKILQEDATKLLKQNMKMNLVYRMNYYRPYYIDGNVNSMRAFLAYEPSPSYISIDAITGEVYLTKAQWIQREYDYDMAVEDSKNEAKEDAAGSVYLTDEEIAKIKELEKLITKEKAIELITNNKALFIDESLMSYNAYLSKPNGRYDTNSSYVWNIDLRDARPVDPENKDDDWYRAYAYASVDAKTGKILSFNASMRSNYDTRNDKWKEVKVKYNKEESLIRLESFLKAQINSKFRLTKLSGMNDDYVVYYKEGDVPVYGGYSYQYNRYNEGIEFPYNSIYGAVDGVTGKIYSYGFNWNDNIEFESPAKAMTADKAFDAYISKEGCSLVYEINEINIYNPNYKGSTKYYEGSEAHSVEYEIRLVYRPNINPSYISPFTGEQLNYDGSVYSETKPFVYEDIQDKPENRNILLLADMNIGFEGSLFYPDRKVTVAEFDYLLSQIGYGYPEEEGDTAKNESQISREEVAYRLIDKLGLKKLAELKGIYTTGYTDEFNIKAEYRGAVALAKGLGLMEGTEYQTFNPKDLVSRAEAVNIIMSFIRVQRAGIY